jgi:hypothetical protein
MFFPSGQYKLTLGFAPVENGGIASNFTLKSGKSSCRLQAQIANGRLTI